MQKSICQHCDYWYSGFPHLLKQTANRRLLSFISRLSMLTFYVDLRPKLPTHGISLWQPADETQWSTTAINMVYCQNNENLYVCCCVTVMKENCQVHTDTQQNIAFTILLSKKILKQDKKKTNKKCCHLCNKSHHYHHVLPWVTGTKNML